MPSSTSKKEEDLKKDISSDDSFTIIRDSDSENVYFDSDDVDPSKANEGNDKSYVDALGNKVSSWGNEKVDMYGSSMGERNARIMGIPLKFSPLDDPAGVVYEDTFESDLPVVFITPGKPKVNRRLFGSSETGGIFNLGNAANNILNGLTGNLFSMVGLASYKDSRFISFKADYSTYYKYVQTTLQYIHASMGMSGTFDYSKYLDISGNNGLAFYASKGTSISESSNNEYQQSDVAREANAKQYEIREKKMLATTGQDGILKEIASFFKDTIRDLTQDIPIIGGLVGALVENLDGSQLSYPDNWANSTFDRSYSLEFRFYSPYGDPESIMKYVYVPFISLISLGLPLQDSYYSYRQPFLVRMSCPGRFECECGVIRGLTIERGSEQTWTAEGLPREIIVRMTVSDLYPSLMLSRNNGLLKYNIGLTSYIECMAGIRYDQLNFVKRVGRKLNVLGSRIEQVLTLKGLQHNLQDFKYNQVQKIIKVLR